MRRYHETFRLWEYLLFAVVTLAVLCLCVCIGSVRVPLGDTLAFFAAKLTGGALPEGLVSSIIPIRLPRVLCVALTGAALSLAGAAMQGLLKNPLADGSTLGVSSGASLGAVCAIAFGVTLPGFPFAGTMVMAILFAFGSLLVILGLSYKLDRSLSTNTIILIGVIFSMFVSSIMSIVITFAADKVQKITFWTMGSLSGSTYQNAAVLALALAVCGAVILLHAQILNAFAVGEDNARQIGVDVKRAKLVLLITVSVLIGVCVSIGGTIGFVGLVTPHMARMLVGPNHRRLLPAAMFGGHALFTISDKTFDRMVEANNGRTGYHIHVSEGMNDVYDSLQNYGRRPVQRLHDHGILGEKTILGHCIHVNPAEIELIQNTHTMVVNNPESNMSNAVGVCPVLPLSKAGILLGLGTDAWTNDMIESLKAALCVQRLNACLPNVAWCEVTDMLFKNNAKIGAKYFPDELGVLKAGAAADMIVMDYKPFTPFSDENIDGHILFGMTGKLCRTTIANGKILMKDRELIGIDEEAENAHILEAAKKLWGALNHREY